MPIEIGQALHHAPLAPQPAAATFSLNMRIGLPSRRVGIAERALFTERLALLLETGVSLAESLQSIQSQTEDRRLYAIVGALHERVIGGERFSAALARHPDMFSQTYWVLVAAGEDGGFLPKVLGQLREMDELSVRMRGTLIAALSYPVFLAVFSIAVVTFMLVFVFPKFSVMFMSIRDQLPASTVFLMLLSDGLRNHGGLFVLALGAGCGALVGWSKTASGRRLADLLKVRTPIVGEIFVQAYLRQVLGVLGMSLANGMPVSVALKAAQGVVANSVVAAFLEDVWRRINEGEALAAGFAEARFIPSIVRQMIHTGEQTGNLGKVMTALADFYARELDRRLAALSRSIEPLMLMLMGVMVGVVVASLILPIFKLSRAI